LYGFVGNDGVDGWDFVGLYNTAQEALNAAKNEVGQKAFSSRLQGTFEFGGVNMPMLYPRDIVGSNFVLYPAENINGEGTLYKGVVGVEYGTYVYCDKTDGKFYYADPIRGRLPSRNELLIKRQYGEVSIPVTTGDDNHKILALVHTHTAAGINIYPDLSRSENPPLNNGPSTDDRDSASFAGVPNFIVWEYGPGGYYIGAVAMP
jgi:hypothetical protein